MAKIRHCLHIVDHNGTMKCIPSRCDAVVSKLPQVGALHLMICPYNCVYYDHRGPIRPIPLQLPEQEVDLRAWRAQSCLRTPFAEQSAITLTPLAQQSPQMLDYFF